jgi:hypothetical protein
LRTGEPGKNKFLDGYPFDAFCRDPWLGGGEQAVDGGFGYSVNSRELEFMAKSRVRWTRHAKQFRFKLQESTKGKEIGKLGKSIDTS